MRPNDLLSVGNYKTKSFKNFLVWRKAAMWNETILWKGRDADDDDDDDAKEIRQTVHTPRAEQHNCEKLWFHFYNLAATAGKTT